MPRTPGRRNILDHRQRRTEHTSVEKQKRGQRLVLRTGGDAVPQRQPGEKFPHRTWAKVPRVPPAMKHDVPAYPVDVCVLRAPAVSALAQAPPQHPPQSRAPPYAYSSTGGHAHTRFRSPNALSTRATAGQNFHSRVHGAGNAACSLVYGRSHALDSTDSSVCGAFLSGLFNRSAFPSSMSRISSRIAISASQNRSSSAFDSLSVGSIISVPATGNDTVGAWNP